MKGENEIIDILAKLVSFQTINDNFEAITNCYDYIDKELSFFSFDKKTYSRNGVESRVWSTVKGCESEYVLNAHIDVVPGENKLFSLRRKGDGLFGRGVSDMKYAIAVYISVLKRIYDKGKDLPPLSVLLTADEERGGIHGVGYLVNDIGYRGRVAFVPDGGENDHIVEDAKGVINLKITAKGKGAHAARLWEGESAIDNLVMVIDKLRKVFPLPSHEVWQNTMNLGKIAGGIQTNQVADQASVFVDIRFLPGEKLRGLIDRVKKVCVGCSVETLVIGDSFHVDRENEYIQRWARLLKRGADGDVLIKENIASDGRYFTAAGMPTIVSKPVGGLIHNDGEWASFKSIVEFGSNLERFLTNG